MKILSNLLTIGLLLSVLSGCGHPASVAKAGTDAAEKILFEKPNDAAQLVVQFVGTEEAMDTGEVAILQTIDHLVLKDRSTGTSIRYDPETDTRQAADFFFAGVWSPDANYLVLPRDKRDGFAVYRAQTAMQDVRAAKPLGSIRVWHGEARRYWHSFEGWDGPAAFRFSGEMEGKVTHFRYDVVRRKLECLTGQCSGNHHEGH